MGSRQHLGNVQEAGCCLTAVLLPPATQRGKVFALALSSRQVGLHVGSARHELTRLRMDCSAAGGACVRMQTPGSGQARAHKPCPETDQGPEARVRANRCSAEAGLRHHKGHRGGRSARSARGRPETWRPCHCCPLRRPSAGAASSCARTPPPPTPLPAPSSMSVAADSLYQSMECSVRCSLFKAGLNWWFKAGLNGVGWELVMRRGGL